MRVIIYSTHGFDKPYLDKASRDHHQFTFIQESLDENTANLAQNFDAICIFTADKANAKV